MKKQHRRFQLGFDRILSHDSFRQIFILVGALALAFLLALGLLSLFGGNWETYCENHHVSKWVLPFYLLIDGNAFNSFYSDGDANISHSGILMGCIIYVIGSVIFTGMLISVLTNIIERRVEEHQAGHIHYLKSGHHIIMGYDEMVPSFVNRVFEIDPQGYVLILSSVPAVTIKEKLSKSFTQKQLERIIVNYGHRTSTEAYQDIHLETAEQVYIVGHRSRPAHDAINVECVDSICQYLKHLESKDHPRRITCVFKDLDTYAAFKTSEIFSRVRKLGMEFVPYNFFAGWAKQVFVKRTYHDMEDPNTEHRYPAVFRNGIAPDDPHYVHLVFVGTTNFAVAFAMEAAHVLHFPNFHHDNSLRTRITFIDINADREKDEFITRNRHFFEVQDYRYQDLSPRPVKPGEPEWPDTRATRFSGPDSNFLDVEFEFIKGDVFSQRVQDEIATWANDTAHQYLSIFLAQADQRLNFVMGMNMPDSVYDNKVPVFIRQDRSDNFVTNLRLADEANIKPYARMENGTLTTHERPARYAHIYPFGMNETGFSEDDHSLRRAKLINYLYCTINSSSNRFKSLEELNKMTDKDVWDAADGKWAELDVALKWSCLYNAYTIRTKLATLRAMRKRPLDDESQDTKPLDDTEANELAVVEHNRWNVEKLLMGFRKPLPDEDKYAHPQQAEALSLNKKLFIHHDIRPYDQLDTVRDLDREFALYIPWIMALSERAK